MGRMKKFKNDKPHWLSRVVGKGLSILPAYMSVVNYQIKSDKITTKFRAVVVSDLHSCDYGDQQKRLLNKIDGQSPDIILLTGDIVDNRLPQDNAKEFLYGIGKKYPCYYVTGNHEYYTNEMTAIKKMIRAYGITILEGNSLTVSIKGQLVNIAGVDDPVAGEKKFANQLKNCRTNGDENIFSILLSHRPERIYQYAQYDFDLILSGHAHGGQWRIPKLLNGLYAPGQGVFPKYAGGRFPCAKGEMIVSRGLARETTPAPRIFNPVEVVVVDFIPSVER